METTFTLTRSHLEKMLGGKRSKGKGRHLARVMRGIKFTGAEGFHETHQHMINKARACAERGDFEGETTCYNMATVLRLYFDSICFTR